MTKRTKDEVKAGLVKAREELDKLEARIDAMDITKGAQDCGCDNPGCLPEPFTMAVAVGASFAGGVSA